MKKGMLLKVLVPTALILAALVFYQNVLMKNGDSLAALKDREAAAARALKKYGRLIREKPLIEKKLESMKESRIAREADIFEGQSLSIASAALQETVKNIVSGGGGAVSSERIGKTGPLGGFMVISASFEI
ncbi:MAG: hypothetical protein M0Z58_09340, partial [Nitrospiraceae bacterium]|nr:hypothetical protein [Nitrospiraceae bacterium]